MTTPHTPPTQAELDALKKLCENASPAWSEDGEDECVVTGNPCDPNARTVPVNWDDCLFMVAARTELPRLITEVGRLRAQNEEAAEAFEQLAHNFPSIQVDCDNPVQAAQLINKKHERLTKEVEELRKGSDNLHKDVVNLKAIAVAIQCSPECSNCGKPATCFGRYAACEDRTAIEFACSECCGHCNEDGWCIPVLPAIQQKGEE